MSVVSKSLPGLFGGVSQQIPALRHETQCSVQDNGIATLVDGLYKRPGTQHTATLALTHTGGLTVAGSGGLVLGHVVDRGDAGRHQLILANGSLMLYDLTTGAAQTVASPHGFAYLNTATPHLSMRCLTVADYTFIVNTEVVPAMSGAVAAANATNVAYIHVRTASPVVPYRVTIDGSTATITSPETPTNASIATQLRDAIAALPGSLTALVMADTNIIKVTKASGTIVCSTSDGWGNLGLVCVSNGVEKYSDLPPRFETGYTVKITGSADSDKDNYHVKWTGTGWIEALEPGAQTTLDAATMPHILRPVGDGTWSFERASSWEARAVGDNTTNPLPSFIGKAIRGAFFHRNRLGFLAGDNVILSRPGSYYAFFSTTAQQVLDTDPIDLSASHEGVDTLEWAVPYNKNLLVWSNSNQQFVLAGGDVLSTNNARLQPTSTFSIDAGCKPVANGNKVLFVSSLGGAAQVNNYRSSDDRVSDTADDLTAHCPTYVPANPRALVASTAVRAVVLIPSTESKALAVFKYEADDDERLKQKAWSRIVFSRVERMRVVGAHWVERSLHLLVYTQRAGDNTANGHFTLEVLDFSPETDQHDMGFGLRLDRQRDVPKLGFDGTHSYFDVPYPVGAVPVLLRRRAGLEPEEYAVDSITPTTATESRVFVVGDVPAGTYVIGDPYDFVYEFTEPFMQDREGTPLMASSLKHVRTQLRYVDTGYFEAEVAVHLRATYLYPFSGRITGQPGQGASQIALSTGTFAIPVHTKAADVRVRLLSSSHLPCTFPYAEWVGDVTIKANR